MSLEGVKLIYKLTNRVPLNRNFSLVDQIRRASASVCANIAEGYGRYSQAAYRSHLSIARGSLFETHSWLDLLHRSGFLEDDQKTKLIEECQSVGKLLTLRMKSLSTGNLSYAREEGELYRVDL